MRPSRGPTTTIILEAKAPSTKTTPYRIRYANIVWHATYKDTCITLISHTDKCLLIPRELNTYR